MVVIALLASCSVALLAVLFTATMVQRRGSVAYLGYVPLVDAHLGSQRPTPEDMAAMRPHSSLADRSSARIGWDGLAFYLTHGYFPTYLSLRQPFVPCYGVGNSMFLQRQVARLTGNPRLGECAYPFRLHESGFYASRYWTTIYPWIASDVTFPGVVVVMGLIGWLSGLAWLDVLGGRNPFAVALLGQLLVLLYYVPAHNKIMQTGEGVSAFVVLFGAWAYSRRSGT